MIDPSRFSRRHFISTVASTAAVAYFASSSPSFGFQGESSSGAWKDQGILHLEKSPYAKLHNVPVRAVTIHDGFWSQRRKINVDSSIPSMRKELEDHGRMDNFRRLAGKSSEPQKGPYYSDSDIYKWTEAVGFALQSNDAPELRKVTDSMIREVVAIQEPSGYLNTYYVEDKVAQRMLPHSQEVGHELYNLGHMLQGAIAYYRGTGDATLMDAGAKFVDGFLISGYGPEANKKPIISGHPEIEMALIELYRTTGRKQYLDLAGYILHGDQSRTNINPHAVVYMYCGIPFVTRTKLEGHAVRAMYACCGATDYYMETGDPAYWKTLNVLWEDLSRRQMYITGGVGARGAGEAFGEPYELPNAQAYGESCAAIGNMMWNWRMLAVSGEAKFADVIERALYNGINSGMSLDGTLYCYRNPLAFDPAGGDKIRNPWYDTTCCPPNLERTFASLPGYFYSTSKDGVYVHLYDNSTLDWHLENKTPLKIVQKTGYPWNGDVQLTVSPSQASDFTLYLRVPGWARTANVSVNGKAINGAQPGQYLAIRRTWKAGDAVTMSLPLSTEVIASNPRVVENTGQVAVQRGPIVFCMEESDQPTGTALADTSIALGTKGKEFQAEYKADLLDGVTVLRHDGAVAEKPSDEKPLYLPVNSTAPSTRSVELTLIPYYSWANRKPTAMTVWMPYVRT
jgi:DUF1680 family protein